MCGDGGDGRSVRDDAEEAIEVVFVGGVYDGVVHGPVALDALQQVTRQHGVCGRYSEKSRTNKRGISKER